MLHHSTWAQRADKFRSRVLARIKHRISPQVQARIDADDVVQSAMIGLLTSDTVKQDQSDSQIFALLTATAHHKLLKQIDRHTAAKRDVRKTRLEATPAISHHDSPSRVVAANETRDRVWKNLSPTQQRLLKSMERGHTWDQIASDLRITTRTARRMVERIREQFVAELNPTSIVTDDRSDDRSDDCLSAARWSREQMTWSDFVLHEHLGTGGVGKVYRATWIARGQHVAIKTLRRCHWSRPDAEDLILREARLLASLHHPNVQPLHGVGRFPAGGFFLALGLAEGSTLAQSNFRNLASLREKLDVLSRVANALEHAHEAGVLHCDLSPSNILFTSRTNKREIWLCDFGFSQFRQRAELLRGGTDGFMAPEQLQGGVLDQRADVFGFAKLARWLLGENDLPWNHEFLRISLAVEAENRFASIKQASACLVESLAHSPSSQGPVSGR